MSKRLLTILSNVDPYLVFGRSQLQTQFQKLSTFLRGFPLTIDQCQEQGWTSPRRLVAGTTKYCTVAAIIPCVIIAVVSFRTHKNVYQVTRTERKAQQYSQVHNFYQNCMSAAANMRNATPLKSRNWSYMLDFWKICEPLAGKVLQNLQSMHNSVSATKKVLTQKRY